MFSCISGLYPLDVSGTLLQLDNWQCLQTLPNVPWGPHSSLLWESLVMKLPWHAPCLYCGPLVGSHLGQLPQEENPLLSKRKPEAGLFFSDKWSTSDPAMHRGVWLGSSCLVTFSNPQAHSFSAVGWGSEGHWSWFISIHILSGFPVGLGSAHPCCF